jgi:DNA-binding MarR family transcriptional regulator
MEIPRHDTPTPRVLELGYGGDVDRSAVRDCMTLLRVAKHTLGYFHARFAERQISPGRYSVLMELLAEGAPLQPSELAARIGVTRPTITGLVDGLLSQGLIERRPDAEDRRRVTVSLSGAGELFLKDLLPAQFRLMADAVECLSPVERRSLIRLLGRIDDRLSEAEE